MLWQQNEGNFINTVFRVYEGEGIRLISAVFNYYTENVYEVIYLDKGFVHSSKNTKAVKDAHLSLKNILKRYEQGESELLSALHKGKEGVYEIQLFIEYAGRTFSVRILQNPEVSQIIEFRDIESNIKAIRENA